MSLEKLLRIAYIYYLERIEILERKAKEYRRREERNETVENLLYESNFNAMLCENYMEKCKFKGGVEDVKKLLY